MKKKKRTIILVAVGTCIGVYLLFASVVVTCFHLVSNNPTDKVAITYIRTDTDLDDTYGEISHISRNILYKTKKTENTIIAPYTLTIADGKVHVYVTLKKVDGEWVGDSVEVLKVESNGN